MKFIILMTVARVGEASHPGPILGTTNPSGALGKGDIYASLPGEDTDPQIWGISESHLTHAGLQKFRLELKHQGSQWRVHHGAAAPSLSTNIGTIGGKASGVAVLSNQPVRALTADWDQASWDTARIVASAIHVQNNWIKVGTFYGYARDAHTRATKTKTDTLLQNLTRRIVLQSRGYRAIMGDFNATTEDLEQFEIWRQHGFREIQEVAATRWGQEVAKTCKNTTTKDLVWISPELLSKLTSVHVCSSFFPDHAVVYAKFAQLDPFVPTPIWFKPHKLPWADVPADFQWPEGAEPPKSIPQVFQAMESEVDAALRAQGKPGLLHSQKGRCSVTKPSLVRHPVAPLKPSRKQEFQIQYHGECYQHVQWCRQLRRLQSLTKLVQCPSQSPSNVHHRQTLWQSIRGASGFPGGFPAAWLRRSHVSADAPVHLPRQVPTPAQAALIFKDFQKEFQSLEKMLNAHRQKTAKQRRVDNPNAIYADVSKPRSMPVQSVVTKTIAIVTQVAEDGLSVLYEPNVFVLDQEIGSVHGWLNITEHSPGKVVLSEEAHLEVGDQLFQDKMQASKQEVFNAFHDLWAPRWQRHVDMPDDAWAPFVRRLVNEVPKPTTTMTMAPLDVMTWHDTVRRKKAKTSAGPDGVSREDLLRLSEPLQSQLVHLINQCDVGVQEWPEEIMHGHITAVEKSSDAQGPQDYRPITILSLTYRTWATVRAKQVLAFLDKIAPAGLCGSRPHRSATSIWWRIAAEIEASIQSGQPLSGFVTDVVKAFNMLARPVVYACAIHLGLPLEFVRTWHRAISCIERHFIVDGSCSSSVPACTGYPEGDPLSVCAMVLTNIALHHMVEAEVVGTQVVSFVDNWETQSTCVEVTNRTYAAMERFAAMIDVQLDSKKSYFWATQSQDRKFLTSSGRKVCHHSADLGGHVNYTRKLTNYTVRSRLAKIRAFWSQLYRSPAPQDQKIRAITTVAWPRCLHGVAGVALGVEHLAKLRSAVMQCMQWNKKGASPILQSLLMPPRSDPGFYVFQETILAFRDHCVPDTVFPVLTSLVTNPPRHFDPGPAGVFLSRLHQLNWQWSGDGFVVDHEGFLWNILDAPIQLVRARLISAWAAMMGSLMETRQEFKGLTRVDVATSKATQAMFAVDGVGLLRTAMNGTFYTRNKQIHAGKIPDKYCPYCECEDSVPHRVFDCQGFSDLRAQVAPATWEYLRRQPECTYLHGWFVEGVADRQFRQSLLTIPDTTGLFTPDLELPEVVHLFTDGSCTSPQRPAARLATWAVSAAVLPDLSFAPVAAGGVVGLFHTTQRAEITSAIAAFRYGIYASKPFWIWTDNDNVYKRIRAFASGAKGPPSSRKNDHDLWTRLHSLVMRAVSLGFFQRVMKVASHQQMEVSDVIERWAFAGNNHADQLAADARHHLPSAVHWARIALEYELGQRTQACQDFHRMLVHFGLRCVEAKPRVSSQDDSKWDKPRDQGNLTETVSLVGIQRLLQPPGEHNLGDCLVPLHNWLVQLTTAADAKPLWLSSYQLFQHFLATTPGWGFHYDAKAKVWELADSWIDENGFNFLRLSGWHQAIVKRYAQIFGLVAEAKSQLPFGCTIRCWQRCLLLFASPAEMEKVDTIFRNAGVTGVKSVSKAFGQLGPIRGILWCCKSEGLPWVQATVAPDVVIRLDIGLPVGPSQVGMPQFFFSFLGKMMISQPIFGEIAESCSNFSFVEFLKIFFGGLELIRDTKLTQNLIKFDLMGYQTDRDGTNCTSDSFESPALARTCRGAANDEIQKSS
eukprot:s3974_g3.t1